MGPKTARDFLLLQESGYPKKEKKRIVRAYVMILISLVCLDFNS